MEVNLKGAARNAYLGVKELIDLLESARDGGYDDVGELLDDVDNLLMRSQPLLACYSLDEHFNGP
tara:strand:- start:122 stop:316 length:195 start_codon:yes stop_codon:yes gene_type:complete